MNSTDSMCIYYRELFSDLSIIYSSMSNDYYRYIITRWRLSNHTLQIEIGRYSRPKIERGDRVCEHCHILEDEFHAIFVCPLYDSIRSKFNDILSERNISVFLNPAENQIQSTATFLHELERFRDDMFGVIWRKSGYLWVSCMNRNELTFEFYFGIIWCHNAVYFAPIEMEVKPNV